MLQANAYVGLDLPLAAAVNLETVRMLGKPQTSSLVLLGDIYMNSGMPDLARSAYVEAIERDEAGTAFETAYRAADLLIRARAWEQAQRDPGRDRQALPEARRGRRPARAHVEGEARPRPRGAKKEAAELLTKVVERDGTRGDALLELAAYHRDQGDPARALLLIERAQKLEAYEYPALLEHAQVRVSERDYATAAELLRRALAIQSEPRVERFLAQVEQAMRS
jgi:tetratricopeptide (TPR) repeat protein